MIKLINILNEIKLDNPNNIKKQLIENLAHGHVYLLEDISMKLNNNINLQNFLENYGYDTISDYLIDEYGYEDNINEISKMVELFFKLFKPNEIIVLVINSNSYNTLKLTQLYKKLEIFYAGDENSVIILSNL